MERLGHDRGASPFLTGAEAARRGPRLDSKDDAEYQLQGRLRHRLPTAVERVLWRAASVFGFVYYAVRVAGRFVTGRRPMGVRRILVVRRGVLGDLVTMLPALAALRRRYPQAHVTLLAPPGPLARQLFHDSPDVDAVRPIASPAGFLNRLRVGVRLFLGGYDLLVCGASYFLAREAMASGAPRRIGLYDGHPMQEQFDAVLPTDPTRHEADMNLDLLAAVGCTATAEQRVPTIDLSDATLAGGAAQLDRVLSLPAGARLVAVHPGGSKPSRRWPPDRMAAVVARVLEADARFHVALTGVASEQPLGAALVAAVPERLRGRVHPLAGRTDLVGLVCLLDRSEVVVSNDTGVMHVARARRRPLVALLGPENDARWGPYPVGDAPLVTLRAAVPCAPCGRMMCESHYCMTSLSVDDVAAAVLGLLAGQAAASLATALTWRDLDLRGHAVPRVTVVVFDPAVDPLRSPDAQAEPLADVVRRVAGQDYPRTQTVVVVPPQRTQAEVTPLWGGGCTIVRATGTDDALRAAVAGADGEFVLIAPPNVAWPRGRIGQDVAALVRADQAVAASGGVLFKQFTIDRLAEYAGGLTVRRSVLADLLGIPRQPTAAAPSRETATAA